MNLVISPHLDDAVLSCGQMIADNSDTTVLTVFAGIPTFDLLTPYDEKSGFKSSRDAVIARRAEDVQAMRVLGAEYVHLDFQDSQYLPFRPKVIRDELCSRIAAHFGKERPRVVSPLGMKHPDHVVVREALWGLWSRGYMDLFFYEELPYRVLWPEEVGTAMDELGGLEPASLGVGSKELKRQAVGCYASQAWSTDLDCVFVPERFWQIQ